MLISECTDWIAKHYACCHHGCQHAPGMPGAAISGMLHAFAA